MRKIILLFTIISFLNSCSKDDILFNDINIKIIHNTCVQTVATIINPEINIGETWVRNGITYNNCFNVGIGNPIQIDSLNQIIRVSIKKTGNGPQIICAMADIRGTSKLYDVIQK
jgi:hypothetical protein